MISDSNIKRSSKLKIINKLKKLGVPLLELPSVDKFVSGKTSIDLLKPISIEELLGRDPVKPIKKLTGPGVKDVEVLVTGAGGSIGKGLCKQLIALKPKKLILIEISEYSLYLSHQELLALNSG
ncbi:nucleoside-diphosphate sugar epimerase, partial [Prochlorococcus sp. HOT_208_60]